jgi:hypothetical protein
VEERQAFEAGFDPMQKGRGWALRAARQLPGENEIEEGFIFNAAAWR